MAAGISTWESIVLGVGSSLLTILLTPSLQHYFWTRQRRFELCWKAIVRMQDLAAGMQAALLEMNDKYRDKIWKSWLSARDEVEQLFSQKALLGFKPLDDLMNEIINAPTLTQDDYERLRNLFPEIYPAAMRPLYAFVGLRRPMLERFASRAEALWRRFALWFKGRE